MNKKPTDMITLHEFYELTSDDNVVNSDILTLSLLWVIRVRVII